MTLKRKYQIAPLVMAYYLECRCIKLFQDIRQTARNYEVFNHQYLTELMIRVSKHQECDDSDKQHAYIWLTHAIPREPITLSGTFRREIGNMAKKIKVSEVQLVEFFRLVFIDIVNRELQQTEDETPLYGL